MFAFELLNCVAFNLSPDTSISSIGISGISIGIRSGISVVSIVSISLWLSFSRSLSIVSIWVSSIGISGITGVWQTGISVGSVKESSISLGIGLSLWLSRSKSGTDDHKSKLEHVVYLSSIFRLPM